MKKLSFVIPCYGSEHTITAVVTEIETVMQIRPDWDYEIIAVNDGSPDHVLQVLRQLVQEHPALTVVDLSQNMGKHSAVMAGYSLVTGDFVVNMDDDGQCPMNELWRLVDALDTDYDVAMAKYPAVKESLFKRFGSRVNSWMSCWLLNKPKELQVSNFAVLRRYVVDEMLRYRNAFPNLEGLTLRTTQRIVSVEMEERDRLAGQGHYTFWKSLGLWLNGFTAFSVKPLRIATLLGTLSAGFGFLFGLVVFIRKLMEPEIQAGWSSMICVLLFIGGMIMMMLGLIGEYIGRIYICINNSPQYVIREIIGAHKNNESA